MKITIEKTTDTLYIYGENNLRYLDLCTFFKDNYKKLGIKTYLKFEYLSVDSIDRGFKVISNNDEIIFDGEVNFNDYRYASDENLFTQDLKNDIQRLKDFANVSEYKVSIEV